MPLISQLSQATEPLKITRGKIEFNLECYLEKISSRNEEYTTLSQSEQELQFKRGTLATQLALYLDENWRLQELTKPPTEAELQVEEANEPDAANRANRRAAKKAALKENPDDPSRFLTRDSFVLLAREMAPALSDDEINAFIESEVIGKGRAFETSPTVTVPIIEKRVAQMSADMEAKGAELKSNEAAILSNKAERIAYLTASWDLTREENGEEKPLEVTPENVLQFFSEPLIDFVMAEIEKAVFGPLERRDDSTS